MGRARREDEAGATRERGEDVHRCWVAKGLSKFSLDMRLGRQVQLLEDLGGDVDALRRASVGDNITGFLDRPFVVRMTVLAVHLAALIGVVVVKQDVIKYGCIEKDGNSGSRYCM